jgi:hypothetical protein
MSTTKTVDYYVELREGWQNSQYKPILGESLPPSKSCPGSQIFRVRVTLPIIEDPNIPTIYAEIEPVDALPKAMNVGRAS